MFLGMLWYIVSFKIRPRKEALGAPIEDDSSANPYTGARDAAPPIYFAAI